MDYLPITAIILRHIRLIKNYLNKLLFTFYWPILDILIWGFLGKWIQSMQSGTDMETILLLCVLLWAVFARLGMELFNCLLEELWSQNIINIFASPISLTQWIIGAISFVILLSLLLISVLIFIIYLLYNISIFILLKNFIIFAPVLFLSTIGIGFFISALVIYFGLRANELAFVIIWSFMPFSGVFYPVESLPSWAQTISSFTPMSYVFTGMREYILHQSNPIPYLIKSAILGLIYCCIFLIFFFYMFNKSKDNGLARLTD